MSDFLVSMIIALCPGHDIDSKGQVITNECQENLVNCAVGHAGEITEKTILKCLEQYRRDHERPVKSSPNTQH